MIKGAKAMGVSDTFGLAIAIGLTLWSPASADERGLDTTRCKEALSGIMEATGATIDHVSPSGGEVFLSHPAARSFSLSCSPGRSLSIFTGVGQAFPEVGYFALLAQAGAVLFEVPRAELERDIRRCQLAALNSGDEQEEMHRPHAQIDCQAFVRDGGGTTISIAPETE